MVCCVWEEIDEFIWNGRSLSAQYPNPEWIVCHLMSFPSALKSRFQWWLHHPWIINLGTKRYQWIRMIMIHTRVRKKGDQVGIWKPWVFGQLETNKQTRMAEATLGCVILFIQILKLTVSSFSSHLPFPYDRPPPYVYKIDLAVTLFFHSHCLAMK